MSFEEQIMSKNKYPSISSPQMEAIVFIIPQIFFATRAVLKIGEYVHDILLTKHEGRTGRISARGLDSTDRAQRGPYHEGTQATKTGSIASRREICLRLAMA